MIARHLTTLVLALLLTRASWAQRQEDPRATPIITKAISTLKGLKSVRFTMESDSPKAHGTVYLEQAKVPSPGPLSGKYWVNIETDLGGGKKERVKYSFDGKVLRYLAPGSDKIEALDTPAAAEIVQLVPFEHSLFAINLFSFSLDGVVRTKYVKHETIHGRDCDVIELVREVPDPLGQSYTFAARWGIDRKTGVPVYFENDRGVKKTIVSLELNPPQNDALYKLGPSEIQIAKQDAVAKGLLPIGELAPDFKVKDAQGQTVRLGDYKGKLLLIDFWASWCMPCIKSMPELKSFHDRYKTQGLSVVSMAVNDGDGNPVAFMKARGYDWTSIANGDTAAKAYKATLIPTLYLIGRDGKILFRVAGLQESTKTELDALIRKNLGR